MPPLLKTLLRDENGAATVDMVVLTGLVIGLCMLFILPFQNEAVNWATSIMTAVNRALGG